MLVTLQPVEKSITQMIFTFKRQDEEYYLVGDQEVVGTDVQEVDDADIHWFLRIGLEELALDLKSARDVAKRRDTTREDW
jgi:hypothetical protein